MGFIASTVIPFYLPELIGPPVLALTLRIIGIFTCFIYLAAAAFSIKSISDYSSFSFSDFLKNIKKALPAGLAMGSTVLVIFFVIPIAVETYGNMASPAGLVLVMIVVWTLVFFLLSIQYYFTVYIRLGSKIFKSFKKCMLISLDNTGLSIFIFLHNIAILLISILFVFMFPGPAGILLFLDEALRLRLLKYDWLEANPGANRRKIPWDSLLIEEREKTGHRTIKNFIFPWKY
jgi:uncharacterized membrane protein YesL